MELCEMANQTLVVAVVEVCSCRMSFYWTPLLNDQVGNAWSFKVLIRIQLFSLPFLQAYPDIAAVRDQTITGVLGKIHFAKSFRKISAKIRLISNLFTQQSPNPRKLLWQASVSKRKAKVSLDWPLSAGRQARKFKLFSSRRISSEQSWHFP